MWTVLNVVAFVVLALGVVISLWLARRSSSAGNGLVKRWGGLVFTLGALGFLAVIAIALFGYYKLNTPANIPATNVKVAGTAEQVARGQKLASLCITCHASAGKLPLDGSNRNIVRNGPPVGTLHGPNLTPGGPLAGVTDGELIRAIREGVGPNNRPLLGMPSWSFYHMSDADVQALVAYLRSQPTVAHTVPAREVNIIAAIGLGAGLGPTSVQPIISKPIVAPPAGVSAEYGRYLVSFAGCRDCHGKNLSGGTAPLGITAMSPTPIGPNALLAAKVMDQATFLRLFRSGVKRNGQVLNNARMPWLDFSGAYSDDDIKAIFTYLNSVDAAAAATP